MQWFRFIEFVDSGSEGRGLESRRAHTGKTPHVSLAEFFFFTLLLF